MNTRPTMSHAVDKNHLNELLVKYYRDLASEYDQTLGVVHLYLKEGDEARALIEIELFIEKLDT